MSMQVLRLEARGGLDSPLLRHVRCESRPDTAVDRRAGGAENLPIARGAPEAAAAVAAAVEGRGKRRGRKPAHAVELLFAGPPAYGDDAAWDQGRIRAWAEASALWFRSRCPDAVIAEAWLHQDETAPHVHLVAAAVGPQGEIGIKAIKRQLAGVAPGQRVSKAVAAQEMAQVQDSYHATVGVRFGLGRGQVGSQRRHERTDRTRAAAATMREARKARTAVDRDRAAVDADRAAVDADRGGLEEARQAAEAKRVAAEAERQLAEAAERDAEAARQVAKAVEQDADKARLRAAAAEQDAAKERRRAVAAEQAAQEARRRGGWDRALGAAWLTRRGRRIRAAYDAVCRERDSAVRERDSSMVLGLEAQQERDAAVAERERAAAAQQRAVAAAVRDAEVTRDRALEEARSVRGELRTWFDAGARFAVEAVTAAAAEGARETLRARFGKIVTYVQGRWDVKYESEVDASTREKVPERPTFSPDLLPKAADGGQVRTVESDRGR